MSAYILGAAYSDLSLGSGIMFSVMMGNHLYPSIVYIEFLHQFHGSDSVTYFLTFFFPRSRFCCALRFLEINFLSAAHLKSRYHFRSN